MGRRVLHLVVDSGAFIQNFPIQDTAENVYSVVRVINEIKDKATRQRLQVLPYELKLKEPEAENLKYVTEFSKKTGDYCSLSATDLQIIALTYQLEKQYVGTDHLNKEPTCQVTGKRLEDGKPLLPGFYHPDKKCVKVSSQKSLECELNEETCKSRNDSEAKDLNDADSTEETSMVNNVGDDNDKEASDNNYDKEASDDNNDKEASDDNDDSDDDSWITPQNLADAQRKMSSLIKDDYSQLVVACFSTDFSIQNVLIQMGLHVLSIDGMLVKQARVFILRCHACFKTTNDTTKVFCPNCGNKTLKRVSVTVNNDGTKTIHINFRRPINIRGKKFSLPTPQGGKHANNPILCEDQPVPQNRPPKSALKKHDVFDPDYIASTSPFAIHDLYSRAARLGIKGSRGQDYFRRKNPNESSKRTGNRKKK